MEQYRRISRVPPKHIPLLVSRHVEPKVDLDRYVKGKEDIVRNFVIKMSIFLSLSIGVLATIIILSILLYKIKKKNRRRRKNL